MGFLTLLTFRNRGSCVGKATAIRSRPGLEVYLRNESSMVLHRARLYYEMREGSSSETLPRARSWRARDPWGPQWLWALPFAILGQTLYTLEHHKHRDNPVRSGEATTVAGHDVYGLVGIDLTSFQQRHLADMEEAHSSAVGLTSLPGEVLVFIPEGEGLLGGVNLGAREVQ